MRFVLAASGDVVGVIIILVLLLAISAVIG